MLYLIFGQVLKVILVWPFGALGITGMAQMSYTESLSI